MEIMFDTANLADIEELSEIYPLAGVTCNPSIIKAEGKIDFFPHFRRVRQIIGKKRSLHIQVVATEAKAIIDEAHEILANLDERVFIKIPLNEEGLKAIKVLKSEDVNITATTIYSKMQGILAIAAGVKYIAPYFNRMESLDIDISATIETLAQMIDRSGSKTKIVAASFKNLAQVSHALESGAHAVTVAPNLLRSALSSSEVNAAVDAFTRDWNDTFGTTSLLEH